MSKSNLDVWTIQKYPETLKNALSNIKKDSTYNILYTNCNSSLTLNNITLDSLSFDTLLYSEDSDILIILMKDCGVDSNDIKQYLDKNNIFYSEVTLENCDSYNINENEIPELWFAREEYVLRDALEETKNKYNSNLCVFYPNINGELSLGYNINEQNYEIDGRIIKGLITTIDKSILLISQNDEKNLIYNNTIKILKDMGFKFYIDSYNLPKFLDNEVKIKKYR